MADFRTETQKAADRIEELILSGHFRPGQKLPQRKIAQILSATTIVVREAYRLLEMEGYITIEPKWGAIVTEVTVEKLSGRYIIREALEGIAARLASTRIGNEGPVLLELAAEIDRELPADRLSNSEKAKLHYSLHEKIVGITECEDLITLIKRTNILSIILSISFHIDWTQEPEQWHTRLVNAILSGDPDFAEATMRAHVRHGFQAELSAFTEKNNAGKEADKNIVASLMRDI